MRVEPGLNRRVHQWEQKLQPLQQATTPVPPKAATWQAVSRAINGPPDPLLGQLLRRLRWYRYLSALALSFALVAGVLLWAPGQTPVPGINYVAVMKNDAEQPTMVVTLTQSGRVMRVDMLAKPQLDDGQDLQLWAVSKTDGRIESLGVIPVEKQVETALTKSQWGLIKDAEYLLVSAVNPGGQAAPGERVLAKGLCVKVEGWQS
ncbi:MAG: anti-sigma factor [Pseudomonadota bacterium]|nr:anti-sigma factor [Pseudomonadota bacterium]